MAIDTNFASLFDKLKLEDPFLPSTVWESIPSQNSTRLHSHAPPPPPSLFQTSALSEASLVRLALNALQGLESAIISIRKLSDAFRSDPADRTYHQIPSLWNRTSSTFALGKILSSIGCSGSLVFLLRKFVEKFSNLNSQFDVDAEKEDCCSYSLVNQAFAVAVGKVLEGYICALDTLYASIRVRSSSTSAEEYKYVTCLTSVVHSEVTLLEVYLHTKELRTQIEALGNICNLFNVSRCFLVSSFEELTSEAFLEFGKFYRGGNLLTYLYTQLQVVDPAHSALLKFLFLRSYEPYCGFIRSWIFKAEINDPYKEFIVEHADNLSPSYLHCEAGIPVELPLARVRKTDAVSLPCFLKDLVVPIVRAGQQLQVLKKLLELCSYAGSSDYSYENFLPSWSGHSINDLFWASPISLSKENLEVIVTARNRYYGNMLEKLGNLLEKLEFRYLQEQPIKISFACQYRGRISIIELGRRHIKRDENNNGKKFVVVVRSIMVNLALMIQHLNHRNHFLKAVLPKDSLRGQNFQVVPANAVPIIFDNVEGDLKTAVSFTLDNRDVDDINSDGSSANGEIYLLDEPDSSESSSLCGSEEQAEARQLVDDANILIEQGHVYSSLNFFSSTLHAELRGCIQNEGSGNMENSLYENCEEKNVHGNLKNSYHCKTSLSHIEVPMDSEEPTSPCMLSALSTHSLTDNYWSSDLPRNSEGDRQMLCQQFFPELSEIHLGFLEKDVRLSSKMTSYEDASLRRPWGENKIGNDPFIFSSFTSQQWKIEYHCNLFSANPILRKNAIFHQENNPGEEKRTTFHHSLPYFDFSSVEDPCKLSVERLSANLTCDFGSEISSHTISPATNHKNQHNSKRSYDEGDFSMGYVGVSSNSILDSNELDNDRRVSSDFCGGSSWQSMLGNYNFTKNGDVGDKKEDLLTSFDVPLDFIIDKCLLQEIMLQYRYVSKLSIKLLEEGFGLREHLQALRRYYFMESADWADLFIISLWNHKWSVAEADRRIPEIQGFLELSVQRSSCEQDPYKDQLFVYKRENETMPLSTSAMGVHSFSFVGLGYRVAWPVNIVLTPSAFKLYADIFNFLLQVKLAVFSLNDTRCSLKALITEVSQHHQSTVNEREAGHFNLLMKIRQQIYHFVSTLQQYVHSQLSHVSCKFLRSLKYEVRDMMDLETVHNTYLADALDICFLSNEMRTIGSIIEIILQCAFDFRSCLTSSARIVTPDQINSLSRLSGINVSQVLTIKKKFEKNLSDLHLCYLKSPKHGEFGISRFWSYLNYNDYYSDAGNIMRTRAFRV